MKEVVILGAGGMARETADIFTACNTKEQKYHVVGYIDEDLKNCGKILNGFPVLGSFSWFDDVDKTGLSVIAGVGNPILKKMMVEKAVQRGLHFCNAIHPSVIVTPHINVGKGVIIAAGSILTNQVVIGDHVILNLACTVSHDSVVENYCTVSPGARICGNVHVGVGCDIGAGSTIIQGINIGRWTVIGAGAVVIQDISSLVTAVGVPARVIEKRNGEQ